jgi:hypothetical protein
VTQVTRECGSGHSGRPGCPYIFAAFWSAGNAIDGENKAKRIAASYVISAGPPFPPDNRSPGYVTIPFWQPLMPLRVFFYFH